MKSQLNSKTNVSICLNNVTKKFNGRNIFTKLNFEFVQGNNYFIKGESGAGKTTLLNILAGLVPIDEGNIIKSDSVSLQYLFQEVLLFQDLTVEKNLFIIWSSITRKNDDEFADLLIDILNKVGIDIAQKNQIVNVLSGGEQRRVQVAAILLFNPDIILLDEPTANLDNRNKLAIIKMINDVFSNSLIIIVSHDLESIPKNYTVLELKEGGLHYES